MDSKRKNDQQIVDTKWSKKNNSIKKFNQWFEKNIFNRISPIFDILLAYQYWLSNIFLNLGNQFLRYWKIRMMNPSYKNKNSWLIPTRVLSKKITQYNQIKHVWASLQSNSYLTSIFPIYLINLAYNTKYGKTQQVKPKIAWNGKKCGW